MKKFYKFPRTAGSEARRSAESSLVTPVPSCDSSRTEGDDRVACALGAQGQAQVGGVVDARERRNERKNVETDAARVLRLEGGVEARLLERHVPVSASQSAKYAKNEPSALSLSVSASS